MKYHSTNWHHDLATLLNTIQQNQLMKLSKGKNSATHQLKKKHPAWNVDYAIDTKHHDPSELGSNWIFTSPEVYSQTGKPKCRFGSNIYPFQGKFFGKGLFYITLLFQRDKNYTLKDILPSDPLVI